MFQTATSLKVLVDNWNIQTGVWLRRVCYSRAPFSPTFLTYMLSALWHGYYPGYYLTFVSAAFFTLAGRCVCILTLCRRCVCILTPCHRCVCILTPCHISVCILTPCHICVCTLTTLQQMCMYSNTLQQICMYCNTLQAVVYVS